MKFLILFIMSIMWVAVSPASTGGRGGEVVDINGALFPRDIVEQAKCDWWKTGAEMIKEVPETKKLFSAIAKVDWYFALELEREMSSLNFCLTGPLKPIVTDSRNVPQVLSPIPSQFVGFRHNDKVLLDQTLFFSPKMSGDSRALVLAHETMHTYIPNDMDPGERRLAVFTMVNALARIRGGTLTSRESLHLTMRQSNVDFPQTVSQLDPYRLQVSFVLGNDAQKARMLLSSTPVDKLVRGHYSDLAPLLASWDQDAIKTSPEGALTQAYRAVFVDGTSADIQYVLTQTSSAYVSPQTIALAELSKLSPAQKAKILKILSLPNIIKAVLNRMDSSDVAVCDLRLCANIALQEWAGVDPSSGSIAVVSLVDGINDRELALDWQALTNGVVELVQSSDWNTLKALTQLPQFATALNLDRAVTSLANLTTPLPREKQYSQETLTQLKTVSLSRALAVFDSTLEPDDSAKVSKLFNAVVHGN